MVPVVLNAGPIAYGSLRGNITLEVSITSSGQEAEAKQIIEALQRGATDMDMRFTMIVVKWASIDSVEPTPEALDTVDSLIGALKDLGMFVVFMIDSRYRFPFLEKADYVVQLTSGDLLPYRCNEVWYDPEDPNVLKDLQVHENAVKVFIMDKKFDSGTIAVFIRMTMRQWRIESAPKYRLRWPIFIG